jgi:3-oxoacyl-[acyl-carrier-protein] synthase III
MEMTATAKALVEKAGKRIEDVDLVTARQANLRIVETVRHRLGLPPERMFNNIQTRGNTTAASIPLAMVEARDVGLLRRGHLLLMVTFGSGFTWGGAVIRN